MPVLRRTLVTGGCVAALVATGLVATAPVAGAVDVTSPVVISEVYGGGGNSGAPFTNDFVELYNRGTTAVDISSWSVQYASSAGTSWAPTPLTGSIAPGAYYLVQEGAGTGNGVTLPAPDATGTTAMSGTSGKVALVTSPTALSGCLTTCSGATGVADFVGYGSANDAAGSPTPALSNTTSAQRTITPFANTGTNSADFTVAAPTPKAAPSGGTGGGTDCSVMPLPTACTPGTTTIQDLQGPGFLSPIDGAAVTRVPGIVTGVRATGSSRGFWIQQPTKDATKAPASSAVFVFTSSSTVVAGDAVLVSGTVKDFYPGGVGTDPAQANLSTTEINPTTVTKLNSGNALPATLALTPSSIPSTYAPVVPADANGNHNIEQITTVDPANSALEFWESHEGELVSVQDARVVGPGKSQYGEIYVTVKPDELATIRGGTYIPSYLGTPTGRVLVMPVSGKVPAANVGDVLSGTTSGPVDWSTFGGYSIAATAVGTYVDNGLTRTVAPDAAADQLSVATYNVENLTPQDSDAKFGELAAGVVTNLRSPDVIAVEEIQDNNGAAAGGVAADQTIGKLTDAIKAAGGPAYSSAEIDPVDGADGGEPGGNIRSVFLYNPARVTFVAKTAGTATEAVAVSTGADGTAELSVNPGRVDPTNPAWSSSRKPLTGEFTFGGKKVIVVANHFNSKGGDQSADGRYQPPTRSSEVQRTQQATVLNGFVDQVLAADPEANIVLAGDFNDYQFSAPIQTLTDNGAVLTDLITTLPADEQYTYNFNGISQVLDHIFVSKSVTDYQYDVVHLNSEFADQVSDHDPQVVRIRPGASTPPTATVNLLNINDFHGRIDANTVKFAGTIEKLRAAAGEDKTLFLSAGDNVSASLFASSVQGDQPTIDVLNALGLNGSAVGNHEFDKGYDDLVNRISNGKQNATWDYLGANVYLKGTTTPALPEYATYQVDGLTVGVIGAVTQETPSLVSPGGITALDFGDPVDAVNRVAAQLTDGDPANGEADVLVAEYHEGAGAGTPDGATLEQEVAAGGPFAEIVTQTSPKVAAIFTGHTHKQYTWDGPIPGDTTGKTRPILQTGEYGGFIGDIALTVDRATKTVTSYTQQNVARTTDADSALIAQYPRVAQVDTLTKAALAYAAQVGETTVGHVTADITTAFSGGNRDDRGSESTLGNTVANALRDELSSDTLGGAQIGVVNPGGLRADLRYASAGTSGDGPGVVTYAEANAVLPFVNNLWTLSLTGAQFKNVLEQQWQPSTSSRPFLDLGLSDNVTYTTDATRPVGDRITSVQVDGAPLDPAASYRIGTFSFLGTGGDNFTEFTNATDVRDTGLVDRDAWIHYLQTNDPLSPSFARRGVAATNLPTAATAGDTVSFGLSKLDLTSLGSPANTTFTTTLDGATVATGTVTAGSATVTFTVPETATTGTETLQVVAQPSGTTITVPLAVTGRPLGTLKVNPQRQNAGQYVSVRVIGSTPRATLTVRLDGTGPSATVRTNVNGVGTTSFYLPSATSRGFHSVVATLPDGRTISGQVRVLEACPAASGLPTTSSATGWLAPASPFAVATASGPVCP